MRHRRNARALTAGQLANFRKAVTLAPGDTPNHVLQFDTIRLLTYQ